MSFLLIADTPHSLPFAVTLDEASMESALSKVAEVEQEMKYINALFLADMDSGDVKRLYRDQDGWAASDTAFNRDLGIATPDEYFQEEMELQE